MRRETESRQSLRFFEQDIFSVHVLRVLSLGGGVGVGWRETERKLAFDSC